MKHYKQMLDLSIINWILQHTLSKPSGYSLISEWDFSGFEEGTKHKFVGILIDVTTITTKVNVLTCIFTYFFSANYSYFLTWSHFRIFASSFKEYFAKIIEAFPKSNFYQFILKEVIFEYFDFWSLHKIFCANYGGNIKKR